jgi:uncharacterized membrane protein
MSDADSGAAPAARDDGLRATVLIAYGLFLLALVNGVTAIAGVILLYVKRADARGTPWEGHFRNLITVFWVGLGLLGVVIAVTLPAVALVSLAAMHPNVEPSVHAVGGMFALTAVVFLACAIFFVWYLIRTIPGFVRALEDRPY